MIIFEVKISNGFSVFRLRVFFLRLKLDASSLISADVNVFVAFKNELEIVNLHLLFSILLLFVLFLR